jgi:hypothetical protein
MSSEEVLVQLLRSKAEALLQDHRRSGASVDLEQLVAQSIEYYGSVIDLSETRSRLADRLRALLSDRVRERSAPQPSCPAHPTKSLG